MDMCPIVVLKSIGQGNVRKKRKEENRYHDCNFAYDTLKDFLLYYHNEWPDLQHHECYIAFAELVS